MTIKISDATAKKLIEIFSYHERHINETGRKFPHGSTMQKAFEQEGKEVMNAWHEIEKQITK